MKPTRKIGTLVQALALPVKVGMAKAKALKGPWGFKIWGVARVLALGVLMGAAVGMYFNMTTGGEAGSPSSSGPTSPFSGANPVTYPDDAWMYGPPYLDDFSVDEAARLPSNPRAIERLEEQISIMLFNAAQAGKPLSSQEIEHLDAQVDLMLAAEAQARSANSPSSSKQTECYPEIDETTCTSDQMKASSGLAPAPGEEIHGQGSESP